MSASRVHCPVHRHAQARPEAVALSASGDRYWTYAELDAAVDTVRAQFRARGIEAESRVALRMTRDPRFVVFLWALWREGAVAVPLSSRIPPEAAWERALQAGASHLLTSASSLLDKGEGKVEVYAPDGFAMSGGEAPPPSVQAIDRPATVLFTSGTTGESKAVLHTWKNHLYSAKGSNANIPLRSGDRWLLSLPLYHVGGLAIVIRCGLAGAAVAVPDRQASLADVIAESESTHVSLVATQFRRLLNSADQGPPPFLRALLLGGGPLPNPLLRRGTAQGWPLFTSYGCTEMASQVTTTPPGASLDTLRTAGRRLPHRRLRIQEDGQILVSGATLCAGVLDHGELVDPRVGGWYPTGDLGRMDASGRLRVTGRVDRQFVSGGENIQPGEVESALEQLPGVDRAVVVSIRDEEFGRRPVGFVQGELTAVPEHWMSELEDVLPRFKIPVDLFLLPEAAVQQSSGLSVDYALLRRTAANRRKESTGPSSGQ